MQQLTEEQRTLADAAFANRLNVVHHAYVDISGDLVAGLLLGQILFWFGVDKRGNTRARIQKDGHIWIAKTRADWHDEIRISPKQYDRAIKILKARHFVEVATFKFDGNPTTHIRIVPSEINAAVDAWKVEQAMSMFPKGEEPAAPTGNVDIPQRSTTEHPDGAGRYYPMGNNEISQSGISSYTENTTEITTESTHIERSASPQASEHHAPSLDDDFEEVWAEYPKKEGKQKAKAAFVNAVTGQGAKKPDGATWSSEEILAEVVLYRQHVERMMKDGELTFRYIPTGGSWFEAEGWTDEVPSISSSFDDFDQARDYNHLVRMIRQSATKAGNASAAERFKERKRLSSLVQALPY